MRIAFIPGLLLTVLLGACASSRITNVWYDREHPHPPVRKVLVLGVAKSERDRRLFEDALVRALKRDGVAAESAARILPPSREPTRRMIVDAVRRHGFDTVLITRVVAVDEQSYYYPPTSTYTYSPPPMYRDMWAYYPRVYDSYSTTPGYSVKVQTVRLESNLYDSATSKLIWSAASDLYDPRSEDLGKVFDELARRFLKSLEQSGLVRPPRQSAKSE